MQNVAGRPEASTTICINLDAIFVSLELSRSTWLVTSLSPGGGGRMSRHSVPGGDAAALLARLADLQKAHARTGRRFPVVVIQRPGLMAFGSTVPCGRRASRAMSSIPHPSLCSAGAVEAKRTESTARRWSARCWRTSEASPRLRDGQGADPRGGGPAPALPRAQVPDRRAHPARQPPQGAVLRAGDHRLRAAPPRQARAAGGTLYRRRAVRAGT